MGINEDIKYYGITFGHFPVAAFVVTKKPGIIGDIDAEFAKGTTFKEAGEKSASAHTCVAFGLLGFKIPLKK